MQKFYLDLFNDAVDDYLDPHLETGEVIRKYTISVPPAIPIFIPTFFIKMAIFPAIVELILNLIPALEDKLPNNIKEKMNEPIFKSMLVCLTDQRLITSAIILGDKTISPLSDMSVIRSIYLDEIKDTNYKKDFSRGRLTVLLLNGEEVLFYFAYRATGRYGREISEIIHESLPEEHSTSHITT